jgi:hypothetical protein
MLDLAKKMAYSTPHHVREYLLAACLRINHEYVLHCQRRARKDKRDIIIGTREIDLCGRLADFFGRAGHLAAQGIAAGRAPDIEVTGPTIRCEAKFFRPTVTHGQTVAPAWQQLSRDWDWLLEATNIGGEFYKRAWVVFWPSSEIFRFTQCLSVSKSHGTRYCTNDFAPFVPYAEPRMPKKGVNQLLRFKDEVPRLSQIVVPNGKRVRCDIIGSMQHPIWAALYTRITPTEAALLGDKHLFSATASALEI